MSPIDDLKCKRESNELIKFNTFYYLIWEATGIDHLDISTIKKNVLDSMLRQLFNNCRMECRVNDVRDSCMRFWSLSTFFRNLSDLS